MGHFHAKSGEGYSFIGDCIIELDALNPQVAARLAGDYLTLPHLTLRYTSLFLSCPVLSCPVLSFSDLFYRMNMTDYINIYYFISDEYLIRFLNYITIDKLGEQVERYLKNYYLT